MNTSTSTRTICCKIALDSATDAALRQTQQVFNRAASFCAQVAWEQKITNKNKLHHIVYGRTRSQFGLGAQLACCARDKAAEAVRRARQDNKADCPTFRDESSIRYDARTYRRIVNLATDSDGEQYSGAQIRQIRERRFQHRQGLQKANTRRARWRLRQLAGKEARFQRQINHEISKRLVQKAKHDRKALALEDLKGIRERTAVRRLERRQRASWAFQQLRLFVSFKAQREGVRVVLVDPRNTSRICSACGHCDKDNRKTQDRFLCVACGYQANADVNAAVNISRAAVVQPIVSATHVVAGYKPRGFNHCGL